jgi:hypothetical protein
VPFLQQADREQGVAILGACTRHDADHPALAVDVVRSQGADFTDAQTTAVGGQEQSAIAWLVGGGKQGQQFLGAEDFGERSWCPPQWHGGNDVRAFPGLAVEEGQAGADGVNGVPVQRAFGHEREQVVLDLPGRELIGGDAEMFGQAGDCLQVAFWRRGSIAA